MTDRRSFLQAAGRGRAGNGRRIAGRGSRTGGRGGAGRHQRRGRRCTAYPAGCQRRQFQPGAGGVAGHAWARTGCSPRAEDVALYRDAYSPLLGRARGARRLRRRCARRRSSRCRPSCAWRTSTSVPLYPISTGRNLAYGGSAPGVLRQRGAGSEAHEPRARGERAQRLCAGRAGRELLRSLRAHHEGEPRCVDRSARSGLGQRHRQCAGRRRRLDGIAVPRSLRRPLRHGSGARQWRGGAHRHGRAAEREVLAAQPLGLRPVGRWPVPPGQHGRGHEDGLLPDATPRGDAVGDGGRDARRGRRCR